MVYCIFPIRPNCQCGKCKEFSTGHKCKCDKCNKDQAVFVWDLEKEYPQYKSLLDSWKNKHGKYLAAKICSQCWKEDIIGSYEKNKPVSSCSECWKSFKSDDTYYTLMLEGEKLAFCSKVCANKRKQKELEKERKKQEHYARIAQEWKKKELEAAIKQLVESLSNDMEKGKDISHYQWETANWLDDEQKDICRKYVKNRQELEELNEKKDKLGQEKTNIDSSEDEKTCDKCGQKGTKYNMPNKNDGKEFCSKTCCADYYYQQNSNFPITGSNNQDDSSNQPSLTNPSLFSFNSPTNGSNSNPTNYLDCPFCQKRVYSEEECNQHFQDSSDCKKKQEIMKSIAEKIENNKSILDVNVDGLGLNQEMTITLEAVQQIQKGEKVNIDGLNVSKEAKKILKNVKSLKNYQKRDENPDSENELTSEAKKPFYHQPWVIIGAVIILLVPLIIIIKNNKVKNRRKLK